MQLYKIIAADGKEYGLIDEQTLKTWFQEHRINNTTLVFSPSRNQWGKLEDVFDIGQWKDGNESPIIRPLAIEPIYPLFTLPDASSSSVIKPFPKDKAQGSMQAGQPQSELNETHSNEGSSYIIKVAIVILLFCLINLTFFVLTGGYVVLNPFLQYGLAAGIAAWVGKIIYKKRMEKRLGRKLWGEYELTSLNSWMEIEDKDKRDP